MKKEKMNIPELGASIYVKELSGKELLSYYEKIEELTKDNKSLTPSSSLELACLLISMCVCDKEGNLKYTVETAKDLPFRIINVLTKKGLELSDLEAKENLKNAKTDSSITS